QSARGHSHPAGSEPPGPGHARRPGENGNAWTPARARIAGIAMIAEANGIRIHYEQEGTGPDLLLIPGLGATGHAWYAQLKGLSPVMRVTAMDPRGHGES